LCGLACRLKGQFEYRLKKFRIAVLGIFRHISKKVPLHFADKPG